MLFLGARGRPLREKLAGCWFAVTLCPLLTRRRWSPQVRGWIARWGWREFAESGKFSRVRVSFVLSECYSAWCQMHQD